MRLWPVSISAVILGVTAFAFAVTALAQSDRGTITGTITDTAGSVIPRAAITILNPETGAMYKTATTETGNYTVAQLPAAVYELTVAPPGFKKYFQRVFEKVSAVIGGRAKGLGRLEK